MTKRKVKIMQALYRTYRPSRFADLVGQSHVSTTIQNQFAAGKLAHAYLFTGPRGIGKTTTARLIAKLANCERPEVNEPCNACDACLQITSGMSLDVAEIDAASNTDVENVRENIIKSVRFAPSQLKKKIFIIDEVHMLSTSAFNALLKTLEEPPAHVLFVLATTEIHKVPETIVSRCQRFDFRRIQKSDMMERLQSIIKQEQVEVDEDVLEQIIKQSDGCARDAESLLGQVLALGEKKITFKEACLVLPASTAIFVKTFLDHLFAKDARSCINDLNTFFEQGIDLKFFLDDVLSTLREELFSENSVFVRQAIVLLLDAKTKIRTEHLPQLPVELAIMELCEVGCQTLEISRQKSGVNHQTINTGNQKSVIEKVEPEFEKKNVNFKKQEVDLDLEDVAQVESEHFRESQKTVFETIPVLSLDEVRQKWPQVFEQIRECNASLPLFMQSCEVSGVTDEQVELGFEYDLYVQTVNKDKNRLVIERALEQVLGRQMKVRAVAAKKTVATDGVVAGLLEQFGGTVS